MTALIYTIIVAVLVAADQLTKRVVVTHMELNQTIPAVDGLLNWTYILNDGASFGMLGGQTVLLLVVTGVVMAVLAFYLYSGRMKHITGKLAALLILAGGIGNLIDRVFNDGKVVDFIDIDPIFSFPKFNVADCCVTVGGVLFCVFMLFFCEEEGKGKKKKLPAAEGAGAELNAGVPADEAVSAAVTEEETPEIVEGGEEAAEDENPSGGESDLPSDGEQEADPSAAE